MCSLWQSIIYLYESEYVSTYVLHRYIPISTLQKKDVFRSHTASSNFKTQYLPNFSSNLTIPLAQVSQIGGARAVWSKFFAERNSVVSYSLWVLSFFSTHTANISPAKCTENSWERILPCSLTVSVRESYGTITGEPCKTIIIGFPALNQKVYLVPYIYIFLCNIYSNSMWITSIL